MSPFDYFILTVLIVSSIYGVYRGLIKEILSLIGLVLSFYLASNFDNLLANLVPIENKSDFLIISAFILIFVSTLILTSLLIKIISKVLKFAGLSILNRFFGFIFGMARGLVVVLVILYLNQLIPFINLIDPSESTLIPFLDPIFSIVLEYLPNYQSTHVEYDYAIITEELI
jgi:membrane protein required for colicin V production